MSMNYKTFADPPMAFRSVPFWSLNDWLDGDEIARQLEAFKQGGFGGAYLHSRIGLLTEYLGEDWWKAMDAGVAACDRLGMEAWFYDEDKWPSGFAGGKVPLMSEDFHARSLMRVPKGTPVPPGSEMLGEDDQYGYLCMKTSMGKPWFNGTCWVDLLNPDMVKAFIDCSYTPYAERYADKVGGTVRGIFTDEPQISPRTEDRPDELKHSGVVSYSPVMRQAFRDMHGYDFVDHVAGLFEDVGDFRKIRLHYFRTVARCFELSFSKQIGDYCAKTGMVWTGHYNAEETLLSVKTNVGNMMVHYRHMQRPGIDHLGLRIEGGLNAARSLSSVANQYGIERRLSEMFGISGQNMSFEDRKWIADWHAVLGINHVCPHLSLYSMKGCRKRDFPPTLSPQQPYWPFNKAVEDYMARVSYATTAGTYAPDVLVIHPLESGYLDTAAEAGWRWDSPRGGEYYHVLEVLQAAHRDYDLGDEQIISEIASVDGPVIRVGEMSYRTVVLPYMLTIRKTTVDLLQAFSAAGGKVFAVEQLPQFVDAAADQEVLARLARIVTLATPEQLPDVLAKAVPPAVTIAGDGAENVWIQRRIDRDGQIALLSNTSRLMTVNCTIRLAGDATNVVVCDPENASCWSIEPSSKGEFLLQFAPAQSLIVTTGDASAGAAVAGRYAPRGPAKAKKVLALSGAWAGKRLDPNALTLDFARFSTDGGKTFSGDAEPVLGIHERFTRDRYTGKLTLRFEAAIEKLPSACKLVCEQPDMYTSITVNGKDAKGRFGEAFYRDFSFRQADVADLLTAGANRIDLALDYVCPVPDSLNAVTRYGSEIESIYLVGEFGVSAEASSQPPAPTQRNEKGFLAKRPVHRFSRFAIGGEAAQFNGDLADKGYPFYAGRFELTRTFDMPAVEKGQRYFLSFPQAEAIVIVAELNGKQLPPLAWSPMEIDITDAVRTGANTLKLTLVNSLRNLLGPHHHRDGELISVGPDSFGGKSTWTGGGKGDAEWFDVRKTGETKVWRDDYHCIGFGLLTDVEVVCRG